MIQKASMLETAQAREGFCFQKKKKLTKNESHASNYLHYCIHSTPLLSLSKLKFSLQHQLKNPALNYTKQNFASHESSLQLFS